MKLNQRRFYFDIFYHFAQCIITFKQHCEALFQIKSTRLFFGYNVNLLPT